MPFAHAELAGLPVTGLVTLIGAEHFHPTVTAAVEACARTSGDR